MTFKNKVVLLAIILILMIMFGLARVREVYLNNINSEIIKR